MPSSNPIIPGDIVHSYPANQPATKQKLSEKDQRTTQAAKSTPPSTLQGSSIDIAKTGVPISKTAEHVQVSAQKIDMANKINTKIFTKTLNKYKEKFANLETKFNHSNEKSDMNSLKTEVGNLLSQYQGLHREYLKNVESGFNIKEFDVDLDQFEKKLDGLAKNIFERDQASLLTKFSLIKEQLDEIKNRLSEVRGNKPLLDKIKGSLNKIKSELEAVRKEKISMSQRHEVNKLLKDSATQLNLLNDKVPKARHHEVSKDLEALRLKGEVNKKFATIWEAVTNLTKQKKDKIEIAPAAYLTISEKLDELKATLVKAKYSVISPEMSKFANLQHYFMHVKPDEFMQAVEKMDTEKTNEPKVDATTLKEIEAKKARQIALDAFMAAAADTTPPPTPAPSVVSPAQTPQQTSTPRSGPTIDQQKVSTTGQDALKSQKSVKRTTHKIKASRSSSLPTPYKASTTAKANLPSKIAEGAMPIVNIQHGHKPPMAVKKPESDVSPQGVGQKEMRMVHVTKGGGRINQALREIEGTIELLSTITPDVAQKQIQGIKEELLHMKSLLDGLKKNASPIQLKRIEANMKTVQSGLHIAISLENSEERPETRIRLGAAETRMVFADNRVGVHQPRKKSSVVIEEIVEQPATKKTPVGQGKPVIRSENRSELARARDQINTLLPRLYKATQNYIENSMWTRFKHRSSKENKELSRLLVNQDTHEPIDFNNKKMNSTQILHSTTRSIQLIQTIYGGKDKVPPKMGKIIAQLESTVHTIKEYVRPSKTQALLETTPTKKTPPPKKNTQKQPTKTTSLKPIAEEGSLGATMAGPHREPSLGSAARAAPNRSQQTYTPSRAERAYKGESNVDLAPKAEMEHAKTANELRNEAALKARAELATLHTQLRKAINKDGFKWELKGSNKFRLTVSNSHVINRVSSDLANIQKAYKNAGRDIPQPILSIMLELREHIIRLGREGVFSENPSVQHQEAFKVVQNEERNVVRRFKELFNMTLLDEKRTDGVIGRDYLHESGDLDTFRALVEKPEPNSEDAQTAILWLREAFEGSRDIGGLFSSGVVPATIDETIEELEIALGKLKKAEDNAATKGKELKEAYNDFLKYASMKIDQKELAILKNAESTKANATKVLKLIADGYKHNPAQPSDSQWKVDQEMRTFGGKFGLTDKDLEGPAIGMIFGPRRSPNF